MGGGGSGLGLGLRGKGGAGGTKGGGGMAGLPNWRKPLPNGSAPPGVRLTTVTTVSTKPRTQQLIPTANVTGPNSSESLSACKSSCTLVSNSLLAAAASSALSLRKIRVSFMPAEAFCDNASALAHAASRSTGSLKSGSRGKWTSSMENERTLLTAESQTYARAAGSRKSGTDDTSLSHTEDGASLPSLMPAAAEFTLSGEELPSLLFTLFGSSGCDMESAPASSLTGSGLRGSGTMSQGSVTGAGEAGGGCATGADDLDRSSTGGSSSGSAAGVGASKELLKSGGIAPAEDTDGGDDWAFSGDRGGELREDTDLASEGTASTECCRSSSALSAT